METKQTKEREIRTKILSTLTTGYYESQEVRKSQQNRIRNIIFRLDKGIGMREKIDENEEENYDKDYKDSELPEKVASLESKGKIDKDTQELLTNLLEQLNEAKEQEKHWETLVRVQVEKEPVWKEWLVNVNGVAGILTAHLLYYFGYCENAKHVSNCWSYAGLTPDSKYVKGESASFNPKLRTAMWKLADTLLKTNFYRDEAGNRHPGRYRKAYEEAKAKYVKRMDMDDKGEEWSSPERQGHADAMARRALAKKFIADYYRVTKTLTGQRQSKPYAVKFGNHNFDDVLVHIKDAWGNDIAKKGEVLYIED